MSASEIATVPDLLLRIDRAWEPLISFLQTLTEAQLAELRDVEGWSVRDHITHLTAWEQSVAALFQGQPRHVGLGVEAALYSGGSFDAINQAIRDQRAGMASPEALRLLVQTHQDLVGSISALREGDLVRPLAEVFTHASAGDDRRVIDIIWDNTGGHFEEHLPWIRRLVAAAR
jgi:hypothetical protein